MPCVNVFNENSLLLDFSDLNPISPLNSTQDLGQHLDQDIKPVSDICSDTLFSCVEFIKAQDWPILELIPAYESLLVSFQFPHFPPQEAINALQQWFQKPLNQQRQKSAPAIELPCYYGKEVAPDLERLASERQLSTNQFITLHSQNRYRVYCLGFSPGFPYLGWVPSLLSAARLKQPRLKVAAGSVGIADRQTGIYTQEGPGGWNIIGRCPETLLNWQAPNRDEISSFTAGQEVRFRPIEKKEFLALGGQF
ncbi:allophanate hydrolase subunit 1 [Agaribacterium sp. ZY112]|uniref:5-oxoprolinase subunit B family protein n=1 Tax=Agaribacterium sp. ZY112 TaxID=3233574 RepID=UPI0035266DEE